jgi:hypothetical protein
MLAALSRKHIARRPAWGGPALGLRSHAPSLSRSAMDN